MLFVICLFYSIIVVGIQFVYELLKKFFIFLTPMKPTVILLLTLLMIQTASAQLYVSKAVKIATRSDAYPYGEAKEADVDVVMDLDNHRLKVSNIPDYCFNLELLSESPRNNGKVLRLSSTCPEHRKCFIIAYLENDQIVNMEIKFVTTSYMYHLAVR
jgi:hypothetical protein